MLSVRRLGHQEQPREPLQGLARGSLARAARIVPRSPGVFHQAAVTSAVWNHLRRGPARRMLHDLARSA